MIKPMELKNYLVKVQRTTMRINRRETTNQLQQPRLLGRMPNWGLKLLIHPRRNTYKLVLYRIREQSNNLTFIIMVRFFEK